MTNAWPHGNLEEDLDAWVDRELLAALKLRAQISRGPLKSLGEIVEEKIEAARNWRLGQEAAWSTVGEIVEEKTEAARNGLLMYTAPNKSTRRMRRQEAAKRKEEKERKEEAKKEQKGKKKKKKKRKNEKKEMEADADGEAEMLRFQYLRRASSLVLRQFRSRVLQAMGDSPAA